MRANQIMTSNPVSCVLSTTVSEVSKLMADLGCGGIPVMECELSNVAVGILTKRDIVYRALALGLDPHSISAQECMSSPIVSVRPESSVFECCWTMQENGVRRLLVKAKDGRCVGIIALSDIAANAPDSDLAGLVRSFSHMRSEAYPL